MPKGQHFIEGLPITTPQGTPIPPAERRIAKEYLHRLVNATIDNPWADSKDLQKQVAVSMGKV